MTNDPLADIYSDHDPVVETNKPLAQMNFTRKKRLRHEETLDLGHRRLRPPPRLCHWQR
jgi:hypothetical protein